MLFYVTYIRFSHQCSVQAGDRIKRPKLAATLRTIAEQGIDVFYNGTIGEELVNDVQKFGGILQMDDLRNYRSVC